MTCSKDCSIKFFFKNKNEYCEDYTYKDEAKDINYGIYNILKTKEDEIVYIYIIHILIMIIQVIITIILNFMI